MNKKAKRITVALVSVLCLLLVLALSMGVAGAWYEARRTATGTVTLDKGIIIDYAGFSENAEQTTWANGTDLLLFATTSGKPSAIIDVPAAQIAKHNDNKVINYYVRAKVTYQYKLYVKDSRTVDENTLYTADQFIIKNNARFEVLSPATDDDFIQTKLAFANTWKANDDGWHYYTGAGSTLAALPTDLTDIFDGGDLVLANWRSEFGGPLVEIQGVEREVAVIIATLTLEAVQPGAELPANLDWKVQAA